MSNKVNDKRKILSSAVSKRSKSGVFGNFDQKSVLRIIDANLNRCREGLRVVEDSLRFVLNDGSFYKKVRGIRHDVDKILRDSYGELIKERDSSNDSGRQMPELSKKELAGVIVANFKRAQESLRVLEEYSKTFSPEASADFKKQRYAAYSAEKSVYLKYIKFFIAKVYEGTVDAIVKEKSLQ